MTRKCNFRKQNLLEDAKVYLINGSIPETQRIKLMKHVLTCFKIKEKQHGRLPVAWVKYDI